MAKVCVIGGGPAGSTFATRMAQLGHSVDLIEHESFPRRRLGESLSPGVLPLLAMTGARDAVESVGFRRVREVAVTWDAGQQVREDPREQCLLVDRGRFDQLLLQHAQDVGVRVMQPARVSTRTATDEGWRLAIEHAGRERVIDADFVADATGRGAVARGARTGAATLAVYAYWRGSKLPRTPRIEAGEDAWFWGVPLPDGTYNTQVFVDPRRFRAAPGGTITERFLGLLGLSTLMGDLGDAERVSVVGATDATPYLAQDIGSTRGMRLGDAALAIDPISSSGVQKAVQSALSAAIVANTVLRRPGSAETALSFYRGSLAATAGRHRQWAADHYRLVADRNPRPFWMARASAPMSVRSTEPGPVSHETLAHLAVTLSPDIDLSPAPCLDGEFVVLAPALRHPRLAEPVAYLGGWELAPLLEGLGPARTPLQIAQSWGERMPLGTGLGIASWLVSNGILVAEDARS